MNNKNITYLDPLRRYYLAQIFGLLFFVIILVIGTSLLVSSVAGQEIGVGAAFVAGTLSIYLVSLKFSRDAVSGVEFLANTILYAKSNSTSLKAPKINAMPASTQFFEELSKTVYDMASVANTTDKTNINESNNETRIQKSLLQNTPAAIFVINSSNNVIYLNPEAENYIGVDFNQALGKPLYDVLKLTFDSSETLETWLTSANSRLATNNKNWDRVKITDKNGRVRICDMSVRYNKNNPDGVESVLVLFDHTDKYTNDEHGIGTISMAVHELRTPITAMRGYIEVFEDEVAPNLNPEQAGFMKALSAQAQQLSSFISNVQNFAKIEENSMSLSLKSEDWASIVNTAVKDMQLRAQVRKKMVKAELPENLPQVAVDKATIYEVLINLIENAIKYTHSQDPIIVTCKLLDDKTIETTVTDKGIGIPEALLGNLFERFYRSHRSSASVGGMGLGLYLSKSIVTAHGGQIWVKSKEGQGSTFGFTLPTFNSVKSNNKSDNNAIVRSAHGWIKNHNLYRG